MSVSMNVQSYRVACSNKPAPRFGGAVKIPSAYCDLFESKLRLIAGPDDISPEAMAKRFMDARLLLKAEITIAIKTKKLGMLQWPVRTHPDLIFTRTPTGISLWTPAEGLELAQTGRIPESVVPLYDTYPNSTRDWMREFCRKRGTTKYLRSPENRSGIALSGKHRTAFLETLQDRTLDRATVEHIALNSSPLDPQEQYDLADRIAENRNPFKGI